MTFQHLAAAARALTARKDGPSLYDVCDPLLRHPPGGDFQLSKLYRIALGNPALRPFLRRTGLAELRDPSRLQDLRNALVRARDDVSPDWAAVGEPVAALLDTIKLAHPRPGPAEGTGGLPGLAEIEAIIRECGAHLVRSFGKNGFIPTYAAFNLIGDPDMRGRELLAVLTGANSRSYKNSALLFNLARIFIARSPARALVHPPWRGIAEPMWEPVQIRHRSAYYDAFYIEALLRFIDTGLASADQVAAARRAIADMVEFCISTSREDVRAQDGSIVSVVTALAPLPHPRLSPFFGRIKQNLGFDVFVPDTDTTVCAFSAATQAGSTDPILAQPLLDLLAGYQVRGGANQPVVTVPLNAHIDYEGGVGTWIDGLGGERPFGNELDPTLNLDILELSFRNLARWQVLETPQRLDTVQRIIGFQKRLVASGQFTNPRSHLYYLPELYCAYFGRCYAAFMALPPAAQRAIDPDGGLEFIRGKVLAYVQDEVIAAEMNVFDAALALIALGHLGAGLASFAPPLRCILGHLGEGGRRGPFKAYEWNKVKTPTRILIGGPEVTSAFVLKGLALARKAMGGVGA